jgi:Zinc-finger of C2H2 type
LCGKEFANSQSLALHMTSYHQPKKPNSWFCEVCGKGYSSKNILDKHVKRHYKENSLVNKWMHDSPNEYKYECTKHNNCKKYFKTEAQFKRHMKTFSTRDYPTKCATQYRPDIDPSNQNFIRDVLLTAEEAEAVEAAQQKRKKKRKVLKGDEGDVAKDEAYRKKKKKSGSDTEAVPDMPLNFGASGSVRTPAFIVDGVNEALKTAFTNHHQV